MRLRFFAAVVAALSVLALAGCANKQSIPELPTTLGTNGLLVARLYILGMQAMENASINIDGKLINSSMRDGYIAVPLAPGDHTLSQIRAAGQLLSSNFVEEMSPILPAKGGGAPTFIYIPGSSYTVHYTTLSVERSFKIEAGKVTNLGLIVYVPVPDDPNKKRATVNNARDFTVVALDNSAEIKSFLDANYPELVSSLSDQQTILAPAKYLELKHLPTLRRAIAFHESRGPRVLASPSKAVIYGRAGTVVSVTNPPAGTTPSVEVLDTGTLADIVGAARNGERYTFLTSDAQLLGWDGKKVEKTALPYRIHPIRLHALGESGLMVIDNRLRVLSTRYSGDKWANYEGAMIKTPRNDVTVVGDSEGVYVSLGNRGLPETVYYLRAGESALRRLDMPERKPGVAGTDFNYLIARDAGLFVLFNKPDYYFWSKAGQRWDIYAMPPGKCKPMRIDNEGRNLAVECDGVEYRSEDSGAKWKRLEA